MKELVRRSCVSKDELVLTFIWPDYAAILLLRDQTYTVAMMISAVMESTPVLGSGTAVPTMAPCTREMGGQSLQLL